MQDSESFGQIVPTFEPKTAKEQTIKKRKDREVSTTRSPIEENSEENPEEIQSSALDSSLVKLAGDVKLQGCVTPAQKEAILNKDEIECVLHCLGRDKKYANVDKDENKCFCSDEKPKLGGDCKVVGVFSCYSIKAVPMILYSVSFA